ncbi:hypothetical protein [Halotia branconii]
MFKNQTGVLYLGKVASIAITPNGEMLVSGCTDKTISMWQIADSTNEV